MGSDKEITCPCLSPSLDQFRNFSAYIESIASECAEIGICKIIPPKGWFERSYDDLEFTIPTPVTQCVSGQKGVFNVDLIEQKPMTLKQFKLLAYQMHDKAVDDMDFDMVERKFWKSLRPTMTPPIYGADISGSLFGEDPACSWNLNTLETILRDVNLPGISSSMLYFGMWKAMFSFHTEDMNLYSINYLHCGKPKSWYGIPRTYADRLERMAQSLYPEKAMQCREFLRHKTCMFSPSQLHAANIPYVKTTQLAGEFVITFPLTYHGGFNHGFNIAEAVNFGAINWIPFAKIAKVCLCRPGSVRIDMNEFLAHLHCDSGRLPAKSWNDKETSDRWNVFNCPCGEYSCTRSVDKDAHANKGPIFECCRCHINAHIRCTFPKLPPENISNSLTCVRCFRYHNMSLLPSPNDGIEMKSDKDIRRKRRLKLRLVKGQQVHVLGKLGTLFPATIADVQDGQVRIHFKGSRTEDDEWHAANSEKIFAFDATKEDDSTQPKKPRGRPKVSPKALAPAPIIKETT